MNKKNNKEKESTKTEHRKSLHKCSDNFNGTTLFKIEKKCKFKENPKLSLPIFTAVIFT